MTPYQTLRPPLAGPDPYRLAKLLVDDPLLTVAEAERKLRAADGRRRIAHDRPSDRPDVKSRPK